MCGIVATFAYGAGAPPVDRTEVIRMREQMFARGPDGEGEWFSDDGRVGLGHRRLTIIDLSPAGAQPMWNADRSLAIIFNGEIYNYRELRSQLSGYQFRSHCDTEVLLALYETRGEAMLNELRGMYAFVIWDTRRQRLFLARDPFGIKPLYYSDNGNTFRVASQVKPLRDCGKIDLAPDPAGHVGYFLWGHVPDPYTLFRNIRSLPAGSSMWVDRSGPHSLRVFCSVSEILRGADSAQFRLVWLPAGGLHRGNRRYPRCPQPQRGLTAHRSALHGDFTWDRLRRACQPFGRVPFVWLGLDHHCRAGGRTGRRFAHGYPRVRGIPGQTRERGPAGGTIRAALRGQTSNHLGLARRFRSGTRPPLRIDGPAEHGWR